jgi:leucyl aminopeptidase
MKILAKTKINLSAIVGGLVLVLTPREIKFLTSKSGDKKNALAKQLGVASIKNIIPHSFEGKPGQMAAVDMVEAGKLGRTVIFCGWNPNITGDFDKYNQYRKFGALLRNLAEKRGIKEFSVHSEEVVFDDTDAQSAILEGALLSAYSFNKYRSKNIKKGEGKIKAGLESIVVLSKKAVNKNQSEKMCAATALARDLVNTPPIDCPPAELVRVAKKIAREQKLGINVFNRAALKKLGAGGILGVSMASANEPFLIKIKYPGQGKRRLRIALVGKGITFDSGGLSIKTGQGMETMKCDMSGAAAVLGAMSVIREFAPKAQVTAYVPTCENMISANALRPGDVIRHMNGKTVEVLNTDAEGRLILADALTMAVRDGVDVIIDLATLTGACVVALGNDYAGIFSNDKSLSEEIISAGELAGERYWPMPLAQEYVSQLKSPVADLKNIGSRSGGGAITAALFLQQFIGDTKMWAHLDIAGPAFRESDSDYLKAGGVGFGVRTLINYLKKQ